MPNRNATLILAFGGLVIAMAVYVVAATHLVSQFFGVEREKTADTASLEAGSDPRSRAQSSSTFYTPRTPLSSPAAPQPLNREKWITQEDNLDDASRLGLQGTVRVMLGVNLAGGVSECVLLSSSGQDILDTWTCKLLTRRARFIPATNAFGTPVASTYEYAITWQTPQGANWVSAGIARAQGIVHPIDMKMWSCRATTQGEISEIFQQMLCFILGNSAQRIMTALNGKAPDVPFNASLHFAFSENRDDFLSLGATNGWERIALTKVRLTISPEGVRTDCTVIETRGPADMAMPICSQAPLFQVRPRKNGSGESVTTVLYQTVIYSAHLN